MKKLLSVLTLLAVSTTLSIAANLDGDTYRAEREAVERMHSSGYIQGVSATNVQNATANSTKGKRGWFRRNKYQAPDMKSYYDFGGFHQYKGYNGQ